MHPENMKAFPFWRLFHIFEKHLCVFQGFLGTCKKMAHKDGVQLICQGSYRIVVFPESKLAAVIRCRFVAVGHCPLYRLF